MYYRSEEAAISVGFRVVSCFAGASYRRPPDMSSQRHSVTRPASRNLSRPKKDALRHVRKYPAPQILSMSADSRSAACTQSAILRTSTQPPAPCRRERAAA